jgi:hypothetical protein
MRRICSGGAQLAEMHKPTVNVYTPRGPRGGSINPGAVTDEYT